MEKNKIKSDDSKNLFLTKLNLGLLNKSHLNESLEKKANPIDLLVKLTAKKNRIEKQKKTPEEIVKARLGFLLKTPLNKINIDKKANENFKNSLTRDLKINLFSKSPSFKTESKDKFIQCGLKQKNNKTNDQLENKQKFMNNLTNLSPKNNIIEEKNKIYNSFNLSNFPKNYFHSGINLIRNRKKKEIDKNLFEKTKIPLDIEKSQKIIQNLNNNENYEELIEGNSIILNLFYELLPENSKTICDDYRLFTEKIIKKNNEIKNNEKEIINELKNIKEDNEKLKENIKKLKKLKKDQKIDSTSTNLTSGANKKNLPSHLETDINILIKENQHLKKLILDQQNSIYLLNEKESKMIKILKEIEKYGINLDGIAKKAENSVNDKNDDESEKGNLNTKEKNADFKRFLINEKDMEFLLADESIINDSDESSFNYFGKPESIPSSFDQEIKINTNKNQKITKKRKINEFFKEKLKLNLSQVNKKILQSSNSDHPHCDTLKKNKKKMSQILKKKFSEQTQTHQNKLNENEDFLKNIEEMGAMWKQIFKKN